MSATISVGSKHTSKQTCRKCNRTVYVVLVEGKRTETDPELITVVLFEKAPTEIVFARRSHAEMCAQYQADADRAKTRAELKKARGG